MTTPTRGRERGTVTLVGVGLSLMMLVVGGLSIDLWRAHGERRALAELADAAAAAGANAIDVDVYRGDGRLVLDPVLAEAIARDNIARQADDGSLAAPPEVVATPEVIVVRAEAEVELTLLRVLAGGDPFRITVTAEATPVLGP